MPRQPRFFFPGAVLHVVQRGNDGSPVFTCAQEYRFYLDCLRDASRTHSVAIHAYVLMTNHVHLLAAPSHDEALPRMMQMLGRKYVGTFNFAHRRTGTLWEGRYKATLVDTEAYLFVCLRYIELNPVRAGMVPAPEDYRWSSHRANAYGDQDPLVVPHGSFAALAPSAAAQRDVYRRSFDLPLPASTIEAIRDATQFEWVLGRVTFRTHVEELTRRRAGRLPMGRPRSDGGRKSRL